MQCSMPSTVLGIQQSTIMTKSISQAFKLFIPESQGSVHNFYPSQVIRKIEEDKTWPSWGLNV